MDEYIEREALMKRFCERCNEEMSESPCEPSDCFAREVIKTIPAADVAPVRHGRWVQAICHEEFEDGFVDRVKECCSVCHAPNCRRTTNYCPYCGAKMDGGDS